MYVDPLVKEPAATSPIAVAVGVGAPYWPKLAFPVKLRQVTES